MLSVKAYEKTQEELGLLRALLRGEQDLARGDVHDAADVFAEAEALLSESTAP